MWIQIKIRPGIRLAAIVLLFLAPNLWAQRPPLTLFVRDITVTPKELLAGSEIGFAGRSMAMGGTGIASASDFSATQYNPSLLAAIRRLELFGSIGHFVQSLNLSGSGGAKESVNTLRDLRSTVLSGLGLVLPYPTYRGSLVFAFGVMRTADLSASSIFGDQFTFAPAPGELPGDLDDEFAQPGRESRLYSISSDTGPQSTSQSTGSILTYTASGAMDISPNIALGISLKIHRGTSSYNRFVSITELSPPSGFLPDSLIGRYWHDDKLSAYSAQLGAVIRGGFGTQWGFTVQLPTKYSISRTRNDEYHEFQGDFEHIYDPSPQPARYDFSVKEPFRFGLGASWSAFNWSVAADIWYTDWTQAGFDKLPIPDGTASNLSYYLQLYDGYFQDRYRATTEVRLGGEFLLPFIATYLRGGYGYRPDPYIGPDLVSGQLLEIRSERQSWSVGVGRLFDRVLMLDVAVIWETKKSVQGPVYASDKRRRVFSTMAYRF